MSEDPPATRLVADAMLGSLARKLRAFGLDTMYFRVGSDSELIDRAKRGGLIILTSDRALRERAALEGCRALLVTGRTDGARMTSMLDSAEAAGVRLARGDPLCSVCDGPLVRVGRSEAAGHVPPTVASRHRLFFKCARCGRYYWKGGHWKKLRRLERIVASRTAHA